MEIGTAKLVTLAALTWAWAFAAFLAARLRSYRRRFQSSHKMISIRLAQPAPARRRAQKSIYIPRPAGNSGIQYYRSVDQHRLCRIEDVKRKRAWTVLVEGDPRSLSMSGQCTFSACLSASFRWVSSAATEADCEGVGAADMGGSPAFRFHFPRSYLFRMNCSSCESLPCGLTKPGGRLYSQLFRTVLQATAVAPQTHKSPETSCVSIAMTRRTTRQVLLAQHARKGGRDLHGCALQACSKLRIGVDADTQKVGTLSTYNSFTRWLPQPCMDSIHSGRQVSRLVDRTLEM